MLPSILENPLVVFCVRIWVVSSTLVLSISLVQTLPLNRRLFIQRWPDVAVVSATVGNLGGRVGGKHGEVTTTAVMMIQWIGRWWEMGVCSFHEGPVCKILRELKSRHSSAGPSVYVLVLGSSTILLSFKICRSLLDGVQRTLFYAWHPHTAIKTLLKSSVEML
jgi:hypothetical protein